MLHDVFWNVILGLLRPLYEKMMIQKVLILFSKRLFLIFINK